MSHKKLIPVSVILSVILLFVSPTIGQADAAVNLDDDPNDGCTGSWVFPPLYVGGEDSAVFAQAAYEFDENCEPALVDQIRLDYVPTTSNGEQKPFQTKTILIIPPSRPDPQESGFEAVDTCHLRTWEEDVAGFDMIAVQVDQTYSWNGSTVTLSYGSVSATTYLSWWYISNGPYGAAGYISSQVAYSNGRAGFYCNGGPFCGGGPAYQITLYDYMTVDYQGGCGGYGVYSGTVVPAGRVLYSVWK